MEAKAAGSTMPELITLDRDYERLHEYRKLCALVGQRVPLLSDKPRLIESVATFLCNRLWVELALSARSTNRPGFLAESESGLYESTVGNIFEKGTIIEALVEAKILFAIEGGYQCPIFAQLNPQTAGNYVSGPRRGNQHSVLERNRKKINMEAIQQGTLLPEEVFKKADGTDLSPAESNRAITLIRTLDFIFDAPSRKNDQFNAGIMADAHSALMTYTAEEMTKIQYWLTDNKNLATVHKTAEALLRNWKDVAIQAGITK